MADRTSAEIFREVFKILADGAVRSNSLQIQIIAKRIYAMTQYYDFSDYQLDASENLRRLGIQVGSHGG